jgi:2-polyprenyl-3-methyl-5-hydroxy-6-metoxy-1,4-benzoquinol methylase
MDFSRRADTKELLDEEGIPFADIRRNMEELEQINTWLGGHAITISGIKNLLGTRKKVHICEIGCGGGDNLKAIAKWCKKNKVEVALTGIDIKDTCIEYAAINLKGYETNLITSDYSIAALPEQPDIVFSSLFCHHFTEEQIIQILRWKNEHSKIGFFINDLHRNALAYHSIKLITKVFSSSYLIQHDAPISVTRGFSGSDWDRIISAAGLSTSTLIKWRWAFRWLVSFTK